MHLDGSVKGSRGYSSAVPAGTTVYEHRGAFMKYFVSRWCCQRVARVQFNCTRWHHCLRASGCIYEVFRISIRNTKGGAGTVQLYPDTLRKYLNNRSHVTEFRSIWANLSQRMSEISIDTLAVPALAGTATRRGVPRTRYLTRVACRSDHARGRFTQPDAFFHA